MAGFFMRSLYNFSRRPLGCHFSRTRQFHKPAIECRALRRLQCIERDAHSQPMLRIDDRATGFESRFVLADANLNLSAYRKGNHGVNETSPGSEVSRAG